MFSQSREALRAKNRSGARAGRKRSKSSEERRETALLFGCHHQSNEVIGVEVLAVASCAATTMTDSVGKENMETEEAVATTEKAAASGERRGRGNDDETTATTRGDQAIRGRQPNEEEQKPATADADAAMEGEKEDAVVTAEEQTSTFCCCCCGENGSRGGSDG